MEPSRVLFILVILRLMCVLLADGNSENDFSEIECGLSKKRMARVAYGQPARPGDHPWIAALFLIPYDEFFCGGTLISQKYVLTAAHCFDKGIEYHEINVRLGEVDFRRKDESKSIDMKVAFYEVHKKYDKKSFGSYDIALIILKKDVNFNRYVRPICLPILNEPSYRINNTAFAAGWGKSVYYGENSQVLKDTDLKILNPSKCNSVFNNQLEKTELCAGDYNRKKDTCSGDSGGPLIALRKDSRWVLLGITSWGADSCGYKSEYGIYTRVDQFIDWIKDVIKNYYENEIEYYY